MVEQMRATIQKTGLLRNELDVREVVLQHLYSAQDDPLQIEEREDGFFIRRSIHILGKVYIEASGLCNLACRTCIRNVLSQEFGFMSQEVFENILDGVRSYSPAPEIFFGGFGEPLTHPRIVEWVAQARQASNNVEMVTNGVLLDEKRAQGLIDSGLTGLWVSLDGASSESYADIRLGSTLEVVIKNLERFHTLAQRARQDKLKIGVVFVAMKRNLSELSKLIQMSSRLGVSRYLITNIMPYSAEMCSQTLYARSADELDIPPNPWSPQVDFPPMDREAFFTNSFLRSAQLTNTSHNRCPFIERGSMAIAWNGAVSPCLPLMVNHTSYLGRLKREVQQYLVGNLTTQSLPQVWEDAAYLAFRKKVREFDFAPCTACASCEKAESNQEDCFGNTFPTCGGCLWAQGFIRCP